VLSVFDAIRGMDYPGLLARLLFASICGALIGMERSVKNRPAGFRTHILICLGGAIASVTGHFLFLGLHLPADVTRLSGQVITGLGFIGAGTIIVAKDINIIGLTTAAGLWATGIVGLAFGSGFYEGGLLGTVIILLTESLLAPLGKRIRHIPRFELELRYDNKTALDAVLRYCKDKHMSIRSLSIHSMEADNKAFKALVELQGRQKASELRERIRQMPGIVSADLTEHEESSDP